MPYADLEQRREYDREWRKRRRSEWIEENGPCPCGETENLEIDHVDPATKTVPIAQIWSWSRERREEELAKCQVLCTSCHERKSHSEGWGRTPRHGTRSRYSSGCRCPECRAAHAAEARRYRARLKERLAEAEQ